MDRADSEGADVANDLISLESFLEGRDIPFGVIFTSTPSEADTDHIYFQSTLEWTEDVKNAIGRPQHVIVQSWKGPDDDGVHRIPSNLPEEGADVHSHTHLILESLAILEG